MPSISWPLVPQIPGSVAGTNGGRTFLGKGLRSPLREDPVTGDFQRVQDETNVSQCLKDGILTALGERVMSEGLGTIVRDMIFEQSTVVADLVPSSIRDFIERWEPRVALQDCRAEPVGYTQEQVEFQVTVVYVLRATNKPANLVFPFYLNATSET